TQPPASTPRPHTRPRLAGRLGPRAGFALQTSLLLSFLAASATPTPLYAVYQHAWGFSPITVTVVFGVYALAVLGALLVAGALSDHVGRRPVILAATCTQAAAAIVFATADGVGPLLAARVLQGLATGAAAGAVGAGLLDLDHARGTLVNGAGSFAGIALGAIGSAVCVAYLPHPTRLVYVVLLAVLLTQAAGVLLLTETSPRIPGARASLRPRVAVPPPVARALLVTGPCLVATWALSGFYFSLGPALARQVAHVDDATATRAILLGGLAVLTLAGTASATIVAVRDATPRTVMFLGTTSLIAGVGATLLATAGHDTALFYAGTAVAGAGIGAGVQGSLRVLLPLAGPEQRAGVLSTVYVLCYLALGVPAVGAGYLTTHDGLTDSSRAYGATVMALAAVALAGLLTRRPEHTPDVSPTPRPADGPLPDAG
ncbi:MFS transporter, partial [Frankia canadensis]|uniref:MFS transporter n=1 Tax=Frankia canadensis TaxID=1836972 RepID=UPI000C7DB98F